ncbi:ThiF family adenylyltransferase [Deinococcus metallilatus]|uniref:Molybdopterin/thiamine biosynthesis adenylyltransferase n=1 Tax=Deinococcus metallilatus TaxID=1211322 RepID=A0ABR6MR46_9DEIO|nr:ThiF family adenylyltransferase [Deinococcus metallilatus]MBB5293756.1 molybdopterin/thiamine biosynthesis adenylyltransferase [Deinococcus metallilatus]
MNLLANATITTKPQGLPWARNRGIAACLVGDATIGTNSVTLRVGLTSAFPSQLPYVQLVADEGGRADGITAHVGHDGDICYVPTRDQAFDPQTPVEVILDALRRALTTLEDAWTAPDNHELLDEFPLYWVPPAGSKSKPSAIASYFVPDERCRVLAAWRASDEGRKDAKGRTSIRRQAAHVPPEPYEAVGDLGGDFGPNEFNRHRDLRMSTPSTSALYLPLEPTPLIVPPLSRRQWTPTQLRDIVRGSLSPENLLVLDDLLTSRKMTADLLVLGIPRPKRAQEHRFGLVAVQVRGMRRGHVLSLDANLLPIQLGPLSVVRRDAAYLMPRGGSTASLLDRKVLLLGCGALGGYVAPMLAAAGVGHLTLVDPDKFMASNTYRHALGRRFVGKPKVTGMEQALHEKYPYLKVTAVEKRTEVALGQGDFQLGDFDLTVDATGDTTHQLMLARALRDFPVAYRPPTLLLWLEALGLGGHHLTVIPGEAGCPRCLYSSPQAPMANAASFGAPYQHIGHDELGCGTFHTPYSDLDAIKTAEEAVRTAIDVLHGRLARSLLRSWKGSPTAFKAAGHQLSERYFKKRGALRRGEAYDNPDCPLCRGKP